VRIRVSLVAPLRELALPVFAVLVLVTVALLSGALALAAEMLELRGELPQLEVRLQRLTEQLESERPRATLPASSELATVRERVRAINALAAVRAWTPTRLLAYLERALPEKAYLASLQHRPRDGEVLLVAEAAGAEPLTAFLLKLESEPHFSEVLLSRQGTRQVGGATLVQFEIRLREKP
jgi:hypothetical protein